jgi:glycogen debranching enzyme
LFAGFSRDELPVPGAYPASCSPQAWAAAAPLSWLRTLLRLDPWLPHGKVWLAPNLPGSIRRLRVRGITLGSARLDVDVDPERVDVTMSDDTVELVQEPRPPLTALLAAT